VKNIGCKVSLACSASIHMANICVVVQSLILLLDVINSVLISIPSGILIHPTVWPHYKRSPKNDF